MTHIETLSYKDIKEPSNFHFYLMRQCTCTKEWKVIAIDKSITDKNFMKRFRYTLPVVSEIPPETKVIVYSPEI
jgi:hypothetical protein